VKPDLSIILRPFKKLKSKFKEELPRSRPAMDAFFTDIIKTYDLPDMPSYRNAMAVMIMNMGSETIKQSKFSFAKAIKKAMSNQVAYSVIEEIREQQKLEAQKERDANPEAKKLETN
jgi:hypothetical protein